MRTYAHRTIGLPYAPDDPSAVPLVLPAGASADELAAALVRRPRPDAPVRTVLE
jgi:hypothetical protein